MIVHVGLSHRLAPVEVRERLAVPDPVVPSLISDLVKKTGVAEASVLSTCNRVEVYAALPRDVPQNEQSMQSAAEAIAAELVRRGGPATASLLAKNTGMNAVRHLFRVASSLDSLVIGEPQILGQLKHALAMADECGAVGPVLGRVLHRALFVGKRVRTETQIGEGQVSVSSVAVDLACQIFGNLKDNVAVMVGAGEMAESAAKLLVKQGARLIVVNRSLERAERLSAEVGGTPRAWGELNWCLIEADIVITSTSSEHFVITKDTLKTAAKARRGRSLFLIDIAVPRDVDPEAQTLDGVYLYDIDDLQQIVLQSRSSRGVEAARAEQIVDDEVRAFSSKAQELGLNPVVVALRARVRATLSAELERSLGGRLRHLGSEEREALSVMVDAATNKLCHRPTSRLKAMAEDPRVGEYVDVLRDLFDLPTALSGGEASIPPAATSQSGASEDVAEVKTKRTESSS